MWRQNLFIVRTVGYLMVVFKEQATRIHRAEITQSGIYKKVKRFKLVSFCCFVSIIIVTIFRHFVTTLAFHSDHFTYFQMWMNANFSTVVMDRIVPTLQGLMSAPAVKDSVRMLTLDRVKVGYWSS